MNIQTISRGLAGVVVDNTNLSEVNGEKGQLTYMGYDIDEVVKCQFEEICYLFLYGKLPNVKEFNNFNILLKSKRSISKKIINFIKDASSNTHPMSILRTSISMLSSELNGLESINKDDLINNAIDLIAKTSTLCAFICRSQLKKEIIYPNEELNHSENFLNMVFDKPKAMGAAFNTALILHMDHGFNASTFTSRVVASTLSDMVSSVTAAVGSLKGPLHGGANVSVMKMLLEIKDLENVEKWLNNALAKKEKIMGFGHRVYKVIDPRAKHLKMMSHEWGKLTNNTKWFEISDLLEKLVYDKKKLYPNVDFYSASTYYSMGFPFNTYTLLFALARIVGWSSHVIEQLTNNRIIRPKAQYTGGYGKKFVALNER